MVRLALLALPALAAFAAAVPWKTTTTSTPCPTTTTTTKKTTTPTTPPTTTAKDKTTTTTTTVSPSPTINNGQGFLNSCENYGISIADCTELLNIAALNGNTINVGGSGGSSNGTAVNNGQQFFNDCKNFGLSVADCAELANIAILNGNNIDIDLADLTSILTALGQSISSIIGTLQQTNGLYIIPAGLL